MGNLTSNSSVADLINKYTHMDKGDYQSTMVKGDIYISIIDFSSETKVTSLIISSDHLVERTSLKQFFMSRPNQVFSFKIQKKSLFR